MYMVLWSDLESCSDETSRRVRSRGQVWTFVHRQVPCGMSLGALDRALRGGQRPWCAGWCIVCFLQDRLVLEG